MPGLNVRFRLKPGLPRCQREVRLLAVSGLTFFKRRERTDDIQPGLRQPAQPADNGERALSCWPPYCCAPSTANPAGTRLNDDTAAPAQMHRGRVTARPSR